MLETIGLIFDIVVEYLGIPVATILLVWCVCTAPVTFH